MVVSTGRSELVLDAKCTLGEGPVWDWKKQHLFWVDIEGKILLRYDPSKGENRSWHFNEMIGAAVPMENGQLLLALESGLATFNAETETLVKHQVLKNGDPLMRFNDGKVGPDGNFWIGSMHKAFAPKAGNLYRVTKDFQTSVHISETTISNGMAWTADHRRFYYIDTPTYRVCSFDFDLGAAEISNKRTAISIPESFGGPDGMCIDADGMLWIAHWGGSCIRRWDPISGEVLEKVEVDAPHITSCCFGGENLDTLYITSARSGLTEAQLGEFPLSGGLFLYKPKVSGTPITYF